MIWVFAAALVFLGCRALRDEVRSGGVLDWRARAAEADDNVDLDDTPLVIVSPHGVEIEVGVLTAAEIIETLTDIHQLGVSA